VVIDLSAQRAMLYRNGTLIAASTVSTGRKGRRTPTGVFTVLEKKVVHRSRTYDNAPMPYMQRLTWKGVAMHAGHVAGHPASHGCIRLPWGFAHRLYAVTTVGTTVTIKA
jgi:lipoprotein-anchoring transpeptidase ErfK/SrfK